ncbi:hypothetical protein R1flu_024353 [Riccia fluitans]|uniref:14-3-3 domain-containing protein n=1 Tax=Riccia fluitans TaxID=41844 RepID=A0ABD1XXJ7_9MARC
MAANEVVKLREEVLRVAEAAMRAEHYDEMVEAMEKIANTAVVGELTAKESNMLFQAFMYAIGSREACIRVISLIERKAWESGRKDHQHVMARYKERIRSETHALSERIIMLLDEYLIPNARNAESRVLYLKMKGDYHWRLADTEKKMPERGRQMELVLQAYKSAQVIAFQKLPPSNAIRLQLALNFSVFYHDMMGSFNTACSTAKEAIEAAKTDVGKQVKGNYPESKVSLDLLVRNYTCWMEMMHFELAKGRQSVPLSPIIRK